MNIFKKLSINKQDSSGETALMDAAFLGELETVKALITAGAKVNLTDNEGRTALMHAARAGHVDCVKALLAARADLETQDKDGGSTALLLAARRGHGECVKTLVAAGANVKAKWQYATVLREAITNCPVDCVKAIIAAGASVSEDNNNIVVLAGTTRNIDLVKTLVAAGADVNAKFNTDGRTILMDAASGDDASVDVVKVLIDAGASVNVKDKDGNTILTWKWAPKKPEIIAVIQDAGKAESKAQRMRRSLTKEESVKNLSAIVREQTGCGVEESVEKVSVVVRKSFEAVDGYVEAETQTEAGDRVRVAAREFSDARGTSWSQADWLDFHLRVMVQQTVPGSYDLTTSEIAEVLNSEANIVRKT